MGIFTWPPTLVSHDRGRAKGDINNRYLNCLTEIPNHTLPLYNSGHYSNR